VSSHLEVEFHTIQHSGVHREDEDASAQLLREHTGRSIQGQGPRRRQSMRRIMHLEPHQDAVEDHELAAGGHEALFAQLAHVEVLVEEVF
jgi:hypothetical protein